MPFINRILLNSWLLFCRTCNKYVENVKNTNREEVKGFISFTRCAQSARARFARQFVFCININLRLKTKYSIPCRRRDYNTVVILQNVWIEQSARNFVHRLCCEKSFTSSNSPTSPKGKRQWIKFAIFYTFQ